MKDKNSIFRRTEHCLYNYRDNLARLETIKMDIAALNAAASVKAQNYNSTGAVPSGDVHDPVSERLERIQAAQDKQQRIERITLPLTRLYKELSDCDVGANAYTYGLADIFRLYYILGNVWGDVADKLNVGRSVFFKRKARLVGIAANYLDFTDEPRLFDWGGE